MKKDIKLVIADIDGTIRPYFSPIGQLTIDSLKKLHEEGILLGIASGRPADKRLAASASEWNLGFQFDVIIGMNGGQLWDMNDDSFNEYYKLSKESIKDIVEKMAPLKVNPFVYREDYMLTIKCDELMAEAGKRNDQEVREVKDVSEMWEVDNCKILYRADSPEEMVKMEKYAKQFDNDKYVCFKTGPFVLEFEDPRNNKGVALKEYCKKKGISLDNVMAFGDADNDIPMLEAAKYSVCLLNGTEETKKVSKEITKYPVEEDGMGHYIFDNVLGE